MVLGVIPGRCAAPDPESRDGTAGAARIRHSPRPLISRRETLRANLGRIAPRTRVCPPVIARSGDDAIHSLNGQLMDCFVRLRHTLAYAAALSTGRIAPRERDHAVICRPPRTCNRSGGQMLPCARAPTSPPLGGGAERFRPPLLSLPGGRGRLLSPTLTVALTPPSGRPHRARHRRRARSRRRLPGMGRRRTAAPASGSRR